MSGPRNILITGATSGIGFALTKRLSARHRILTTGRKLSSSLKNLMEKAPDVAFIEADQINPRQASKSIVEAMEGKSWKHLDNAVLNAGSGMAIVPQDETSQQIEQTLSVNLTSNIALAHSLFPLLDKSQVQLGGKLTFIGSTARKGAPAFASYAASKSGLHGFARALTEEWRGRIEVQMLHLGPTKTEMHAKAGFDPGYFRLLFLNVDDMASMVEKSLASRTTQENLTLVRYWSGASFIGKNL